MTSRQGKGRQVTSSFFNVSIRAQYIELIITIFQTIQFIHLKIRNMKKLVFLFAMVLAVSMAMAQKIATVTQNGNYNTADVFQNSMDGDANSIYATQSGDFNDLITEQRGNNNYLELTQGGDFNEAIMEQYSKGTAPNLNNALLVQSGLWNEATLSQKEDPLNFPDNSHNVGRMTQSGNNNSYALNQGGNEWNPLNENYLVQSGNDNEANVDQFGYTDFSDIRQFGTSNEASLIQTAGQGGAGTATSYSVQLGTDNQLDILQDYDPLSQYANSYQNGVGNTTNIRQEGNGAQTVVAVEDGTDAIFIEQIGF